MGESGKMMARLCVCDPTVSLVIYGENKLLNAKVVAHTFHLRVQHKFRPP